MMPEPRILIFGGSGFVGGNLAAAALQRGWQVTLADSSYSRGVEAADWKKVDIIQANAVDQIFQEITPAVVVNVAAIADIDAAEQRKKDAWQVNVEGARLVAAACGRLGLRHVFFSSDAVFDGRGGPYREDDPPNPVNYYGYTKAEAEKAVQEACPKGVILRISLALGFPVTRGNSFLDALKRKLDMGTPVLCPLDEIRTPVDILTLCECVLALAENSYPGRLHIGCTESVSRFELTRLAAQKMGYPTDLILPQNAPSEAPGRAPRHKNGILDISTAQRILTSTPMLTLQGTIDRAIMGCR